MELIKDDNFIFFLERLYLYAGLIWLPFNMFCLSEYNFYDFVYLLNKPSPSSENLKTILYYIFLFNMWYMLI